MFIANALRQKVEGGGQNILTFPTNIQIVQQNGPSLTISSPNTSLHYSQKLLTIGIQGGSVHYKLIDAKKAMPVKSIMRNRTTTHLREYNNYTISMGYRSES